MREEEAGGSTAGNYRHNEVGEVTTQDAENNITTIKQDETTEQETYLT